MKVLLPTKNKIKIEKWGGLIKELGYELVTLNDLSVEFNEPIEDGNTVIQNAIKKSEYYYKKTGITTIATDSSLFINGLPAEEQIGLFAGRAIIKNEFGQILSERKLSDDENYQRLKNKIEALGNKATGYFEEGIIIYYATGTYDSKSFIMNREFRTPGSKTRKENAPMRSFTYYDKLGKYRSEMTNEEANLCEGHIFEEQKEFIRNTLNKVDNLMDYNLNILIDRILECKSHLDINNLNETLKAINHSCICIGNGGSSAASLFASLILEAKNKIISIDKSPRDILYKDISIFRNIFAVTYGNHNYGITKALKHARSNNLNTYILTNDGTENALDNIIHYKTFFPKEYSFISMASTFMPMTIMLMYYLGITNENDLNSLLWEIYNNSKNTVAEELETEFNSIEIMSGDNTYVAARILESTIAESGIGIPVVHEKYDYCHGRSSLSYYYPNNILIYLINGNPTDLDNHLLKELQPYYKAIIPLKANYKDKIINEFVLAMKAIFLCQNIAKKEKKDLSKLKYSPVVKKLYKYKGDM